jgi:hypothetical protein
MLVVRLRPRVIGGAICGSIITHSSSVVWLA